MSTQRQNLRVQKWVAIVSVILLIAKFVAYLATHSVAILTDALESIVNVVAGLIGLYSLYVAAKPRDEDHPYGHGKAEFLSAAVEGTLIGIAGIIIIYEAVRSLITPGHLQKLDTGIWLVACTAVVNYIMGWICVRYGKKNQSLALVASGRHLQTDTLSTIGVIIGLVLLLLTGWQWVDAATAIVFGCVILFSSYHILRSSIAGIMDEADKKLLNRIVALLNANRRENWIDLHNLRVIKYGSVLHIDCHLTVPWYLNVLEAHREIDALSALVRKEFGESVELFVHGDGCQTFSCPICIKKDCAVRKHNFERRLDWTPATVIKNKKHSLENDSKDYNHLERTTPV